ncbi:MAG: membrane protein insertion efficiency factor YidD [Clostridia bacterium]|nr:membrane protein insertion efficiency factor YidD [Clostridia bacterium]MBQ3067052.1 membrane protein insertion efficiency factor YidD [Clostridia bacterium]MBR2965974.1 membrane protein insertion efficiency factor YidD [Clostridia bacterium]
MKHICIALLRLYKATLSKWKGGKRCIYTPSCSVYSMEAYQQHGFFVGSWLTLKRLCRCAPWGKGGFDPVPTNLKGQAKWFV